MFVKSYQNPDIMKFRLENYSNKSIKLLILCCSIPIVLIAQSEVNNSLQANQSLIDSISFLSPVAISPFWTLFLTSFASTWGMGNSEFLAANPILNNWFITVLAFLLVILTTLPNLIKVAKPVGLAASFLEDKASYVVYGITMVAPYLFAPEFNQQQGIILFGLFDLPFHIVLIVVFSIPYLLIVITVRYFIEILIFLSPIPLLDGFFELAKKGISFILVLLYIFVPVLGGLFSVIIFGAAFYFYNRAKGVTNHFKYIYVFPIISRLFGRSVSVEPDADLTKKYAKPTLAIQVLNQEKMGTIPKKRIIWLVKDGESLYLHKDRFLRSSYKVDLGTLESNSFEIGKDLSHVILNNKSTDTKLLINSTYKSFIETIANALNASDIGNVGLAKRREEFKDQSRQGISRVLSIFSTRSILANKDNIIS